MRHDDFIPANRLDAVHSRGYLPHWQVEHAIYFVTFRLADSLPKWVVLELKQERDHFLRFSSSTERARLNAAFAARLDLELDAGRGTCLLRDHGSTVAEALKHFDSERYDLHAWCVMPNHVHVLVQPHPGNALPRILHSWKSYTAHVIGRGPIWQREYFDRVIRTSTDYATTKSYIQNNPAKAGLKDWQWVG